MERIGMKKWMSLLLAAVLLFTCIPLGALAEEGQPGALGVPAIEAKPAADGVVISWEAVEAAQAYEVYRSTDGGEWQLLDTVTDTSCTDSNVESGVTVRYTVRACAQTDAGTVYSDSSGEASVFFVEATLSNVAAGISIKWTAVEGASYYRVSRRVPGGDWETVCANTEERSFVDAAVEAGVSYQYAVRACVDGAFTDYNDNLEYMRVSQPKAKAVNESEGVQLTWNEIAEADGYSIYRKVKGGSWQRLDTVTDTQYLDTTAKSGTSYTYTVRAKNGDSLSSNKNRVTIERLAQPELTMSNTAKGVSVSWDAVEGAASYRVYRKTADGDWELLKKGVKGLSYTDTTAQSGVTYYYSIRAFSSGKLSAYHAGESFLRLEQPKISVSIKPNGVACTWNEVTGAESYNVYRRVPKGKWELLGNTDGTSYRDKTAESGATYDYGIRAVSGDTLSSINNRERILWLGQPEAAVSISSKGIAIHWTAVEGAEFYRVSRKVPGGKWKAVAEKVEDLQFIDTTAKSGSTYIYTVRACVGDVRSTYRSTEEITYLSRPVITAETVSTTAVKLKWDAVKGAGEYIVYIKSGSGAWEEIYTGTDTAYTAENLTFGESYSFSVRAVSGDTRSYRSVKVTGKATYPAPVCTTELEKGEGIRISWTAVEGAGSYRVYRRTEGGSWKWLKTVDADTTSHVDTKGKRGATYDYAVRAFELEGAQGIYGILSNAETTLYSAIDPDKPMIALTFDDGPSKYTADILDALEEYGGHATFFVVGNRVSSFSNTVKRAYEMGCEIGNHSWNHPALSSISVSAMKSQLSRTDDAIEEVIGVKPTLLRPPYGAVDSDVKRYAGKPLIHWSIDTRDWATQSSSRTISSVLNNVQDGSIILMHDIYSATRNAAVSLIPTLVERGYQLVTVSELAAYRGIDLKDGTIYYALYP